MQNYDPRSKARCNASRCYDLRNADPGSSRKGIGCPAIANSVARSGWHTAKSDGANADANVCATVSGNAAAAAAAALLQWVSSSAAEACPQQGAVSAAAGSTSSQVTIPNNLVGKIIGSGGETLKMLMQQSGCNIQIAPEGSSIPGVAQENRVVTMIGNPQAIAAAQQLMRTVLLS